MKNSKLISLIMVAFLLILGLIACESNSTATSANNTEFGGDVLTSKLSAAEFTT